MRKYVIGSIEAIATVIAILTIAGIINSVIGLVGKSQIFGTILLSAIGLIWSLFNYKKDKNYKYIAYPKWARYFFPLSDTGFVQQVQ